MYESALITGGAAFVGTSLALALRRRFPEMRLMALDNLHRRGSELNLDRLREAGFAFFARGYTRAGRFRRPAAPSRRYYRMLRRAFRAGRLRRFPVFLSTSRVYPARKLNALAFREETDRFALADEQSLPGCSGFGINEDFPLDGRAIALRYDQTCLRTHDRRIRRRLWLRLRMNRCGLIAGPRADGQNRSGRHRPLGGRPLFSPAASYIGFGGQGKQVRDVLHIDDLCDLVIDQVLHPNRYQGHSFNAGGGTPFAISLRELTALCREVTGNEVELGSSRPADVRIYVTDQ